jgi:Asp-tRNA(Asn)/Glu-tRNA(Gln) amidotransferase A subunit family amidase
VPTTAGSPGLRIHFSSATAPVRKGLMDKGAIVMGKVALHELDAPHLR